MTSNGQQPGVPFSMSNGSTGSPDRPTFKTHYSSNLVSLQKSSVKLVEVVGSTSFSIAFCYDAVVDSDVIIRIGVTDANEEDKIS